MASQAVNEILAAEKDARCKLQAAQTQAAQLVETARADGQNLISEKQAEAKKQADALFKSALAEAETIRGQKAGEAKKQAEILRSTVQEKQKKAVDTVISLIIPANQS